MQEIQLFTLFYCEFLIVSFGFAQNKKRIQKKDMQFNMKLPEENYYLMHFSMIFLFLWLADKTTHKTHKQKHNRYVSFVNTYWNNNNNSDCLCYWYVQIFVEVRYRLRITTYYMVYGEEFVCNLCAMNLLIERDGFYFGFQNKKGLKMNFVRLVG